MAKGLVKSSMGLRTIRRSLMHHKKKAREVMTTAYLSVPPDTTVETTIARLRAEAQNLEMLHYIYIVNTENVLQGVVSVRSLLAAQPWQPLTEIWRQRVISVKPEANQKEIVELFAKYRLQALPVLDEGNHLKGVIHFQSVLDKLAP